MKPPLPQKISGCAPALRHYSFCTVLHLKCLTVFWYSSVSTTAQQFAQWPYTTASDTLRTLANSKLCLCWYMQTYSSIFSIIKAYLHIQAYSGIFSTFCNPDIFTTLSHSMSYIVIYSLLYKTYLKPCKTLTWNTESPVIVRTVYSGIIQPYSSIFRTLGNACTCRNLS